MRPEKLSDPRKPKLRRNRITSADLWPFWPPGNRIDAKFGAPAEIPGLERLTAKSACLQKPAISCLVITLIAAFLGFGGIAGTASGIAQALFYVFLVIFLVVLVMNFMGRRRGPMS
jgi:uncharacterized membrane protein YtjA (UPF0391 family)